MSFELLNFDKMSITKKEIEKPRSAKDLLEWVEDKIRKIGETPEGKQSLRFRKGCCKELLEESLPLGIFCKYFFDKSQEVEIRHILGSQNYDAEVTDNRIKKSSIRFIEVTQAHEGENAHLRVIAIENKGHANVLGKVTKSGIKNTGITVEVENIAVKHEDTVDAELNRIKKAALKKSSKQYPHDTALIIVCDDSIAFAEPIDVDRLKDFMVSEVIGELGNFSLVVVVGRSKKMYLEFNIRKPIGR